MKLPKISKLQLIEIDWVDSTHESGWESESSYDSSEKCIQMKTTGYFFKEEKNSICVFQSYAMEKRPKGYIIDAVMQIPKVSITRVKKLK